MPGWIVYCRDRPGTAEVREQLVEAHWSFMDGYAERMIARGPTLTEDGLTATGSLHVVDLPDAQAIRVFAYEEPNYEAGVYAEVLIRRFRNLLGRTMWQFAGATGESSRYLLLARSSVSVDDDAEREFVAAQDTRLIVYGQLRSEDGSASAGHALAVEATTRSEVEGLVAAHPLAGSFDSIEVHRWRFGGRPAN